MAETVNAQAYNSLWQFRMDAWSSLEEASDRLGAAAGSGRPLDKLAERVTTLLDELDPIERYWAYPGAHAYQQGRRLLAAGKYTRFARAVASLNRGLVTGSYRSGAAWSVATAIQEPFERDTGLPIETQGTRPYFEVLLVEDMPDAQERALREELRKWRRPDDEFAYELVIVHNFEDALIAARLNYNIQALAGIRPELDLYLMTGNKIPEISLEDVAGWMGHYFRRIFHSTEGTLELHLSLLNGVAQRHEAPFFNALKQYSHRLDTPPAANRSDPQEPGISRVLLPCQIFSQSLGGRRPCLVEKQGGDLGFEESTMPTQGADAPQAPLVRPPGDGPGVHPEHQRNLPRCQ